MWVRLQPGPRIPRHPYPTPPLSRPASCSLRPSPLHCRNRSPRPSSTVVGGHSSSFSAPGFPFTAWRRHTAAATRTAQLVPARRSRCTPPPHLCFSPPFPSLSVYLLSWRSFPGGDDSASGGAIRSLQGPLPRRAPTRYALPFPSLPDLRNGAPQTLIQAICIRISPSHNILPNCFDFV
jgi:hypothetical protein